MSSNIREFNIGLKKFTEQTLPEDVRKLRNAVALEAHRGVIQMTPVDTGRLRGNWSVSTDTNASGFNWDKTDVSGNATIAEGAGAIAATKEPWVPLAIYNGIEYGQYVNDGSPTNTAVRMVERTVARIRRMFK